MKKIKVFAVCAAIIGAFCFGNSLRLGDEKHPFMHAAKKNLEQAKKDLEAAANDFGGHRVKAIGLIDQAIGEIKEGIAVADKK